MDKILIAKIILIRRLRQRLRRKQRTCYIRQLFLNRGAGAQSQLLIDLRDDPYYHFRFFRMNKENFDILLDQISPLITHAPTHIRPISPIERLAITLRFLASGNSQISLAVQDRISPSSISMILRETLHAIIQVLNAQYLPKPTEETWKTNEQRFRTQWNFPLACGAMDGKHVRVKAPSSSGSLYYNYKGFFSIVLLAIANADFQFTAVDIGAFGSESDGGILSKSAMGQRLEAGTFGFPPPLKLSQDGPDMPHVLLGDDAFPLRQTMMKPFKGNFLSKENRIFNYRLSRARMAVENSFGILAARWRIYHSVIEADVKLVSQIVHATVLLHNYLTSKSDFNNITADRYIEGEFVQGNWRETTRHDSGIMEFARQGSNNYATSAATTRENFKNYFVSDEGSVPWQDAHVDAGR